MARTCSDTEHISRATAIIRRTAVYAGVTLATIGAVTVFAGSSADAAEIDLDEATSSEIQDHLDGLESDRDAAAGELDTLEQQLEDAQAIVDETTDAYASTGAQLGDVTAAVDAADNELDAKVSTLVGYAQLQSDMYDEAADASARAEKLEAKIDDAQAKVDGLDKQIGTAEDAYDEAAAAEEAAEQAKAEEEAASEAASDSTASYSSDAATAAVEFAEDQLGEAYVYGSAGPDTWDCSGLVQGAYAVSGISLTHSTYAMWDETSEIGRDDLQPGDLVFYEGLGHMGIYIGDGQVLHAPSSGDVVKISDIDMMGIDGYRRV